jgi:hypothetical protein
MMSCAGNNFRVRFSKGSKRSPFVQGRSFCFGGMARMMILLQFSITIDITQSDFETVRVKSQEEFTRSIDD